MNEFIKFIFSSFWVWAGFNIMIFVGFVSPVCCIVESIAKTAVRKYEIDKSYEQLERDRQRNKNDNSEKE